MGERARITITIPEGASAHLSVDLKASDRTVFDTSSLQAVDQLIPTISTGNPVQETRNFVEITTRRRSVRPELKPEVFATDHLAAFVEDLGAEILRSVAEDFVNGETLDLSGEAQERLKSVAEALSREKVTRKEANRAGIHGFSLREGIASYEEKRSRGLKAVDIVGKKVSGLFTVGKDVHDVFLTPRPTEPME